MGDSDDEYDRRRARDKFRRERSDYQERRDDRSRREDFPESRDRSGRREYRDYDPRGRRGERYSPPRHDLSPPVKRMRRDWEDRGGGGYGGNYGGGGYDMGYPPSGGGGGPMMPPGHWGGGGGGGGGGAMGQDMGMMHGEPEVGLTQPLMKTFKAFLGMQDDTIDDQEAVKKYNEYKQDFKKNQISEFFINHKEEEWFKSKYHPEEYGKRHAEQMAALTKRLDTFMELLDANWVDQVAIDVDKSEQIVRLLDAVVIKLEGGTDNDLRALDEPIEEEKPKDDPPAPRMLSPTSRSSPSKTTLSAKSTIELEENKNHKEKVDKKSKSKKKQGDSSKKRSSDSENDDSSDSSGSSSGEEDSEDDDEEDDDEEEEEEDEEGEEETRKKKKKKKPKVKPVKKEEPEVKKEPKEHLKVEKSVKEEKMDVKEEPAAAVTDIKPLKGEDAGSDTETKVVKEEGAEAKEEGVAKEENPMDAPNPVKEDLGPAKPRPLHRTCSIFLRNLAPTITKQEVETICKRYNGFLRVAIADPQPERRFFRRGWVTFERTENIKDTCWNLNNIRLRDCELGAIVNRDLSRRIRSVNGITAHKQVVRSDIKLSARIIQNLDGQKRLWVTQEYKDLDHAVFGLGSKNPLLKNITDYLIEEASAEEEELLGVSATEDPAKEGEDVATTNTNTLERDETLIKVLDRLLLYLRIVHSVDYYNHSEYPNEDEMPNRCGIMHARGSNPTTKVTPPEILEYIRHFEQKVSQFLQPQSKLSEEEANKLGRKDPEAEVEKFVQANSQELAKDKWLCPLSGKKFKGPEFIRKHICNKHGEKVDEVKKEVEYFNNYLQDPKRPQLPEHPANRQQGGPGGPRDMMMPYHGGPAGAFPPGAPPFPGGPPGGFRGPPPAFVPGGFGGRNNFPEMYNRGFNKRNNYGRGGRTDPRAIIDYHDLDYPQDLD